MSIHRSRGGTWTVKAPFTVNGLEWMLFRENPGDLLHEARDLVERRTKGFEVLLQGDWDVAVCVYVETDRLQHAFGAYLLPSHPDYARLSDTELAESLRELYRLLDAHVQQLRAAAGAKQHNDNDVRSWVQADQSGGGG
jgi:predicted AlkP superfamily phosphohydrolase/phosphomutase